MSFGFHQEVYHLVESPFRPHLDFPPAVLCVVDIAARRVAQAVCGIVLMCSAHLASYRLMFFAIQENQQNEYNLIKWEIHYTEAKCRSECSAIDNCVAFAYKDKNHLIGDNCYLYGNGPYT